MICASDAADVRRQQCPIRGHSVATGETVVNADAICLHCGTLLWCVESRLIPVAESSSEMEEFGPCEIPDTFVIGRSVAGLIPKKAAYRYGVIAAAEFPNGILIAATPPLDNETVEMLRFIVNAPVLLVWADRYWVARQLASHYDTNDHMDGP